VTDRRNLLLAFEAAWARRQTENPGEPVEGLDQAFQDALLRSLRWHRAMLVGEVVPVALSYLSNNPNADERTAFDHVLVDEYQDLIGLELVLLVIAGAIVVGGALATYLVGRAWPVVALLPALFAAAAWYGWEFSSEAVVFVAAIAIFGYAGVALGLGVRRVRTR
jgi:hypothetical protein